MDLYRSDDAQSCMTRNLLFFQFARTLSVDFANVLAQ